ncbi:MAG: gamma-glutamylcyclotransferase [bacterium]
MPHPEILSIRAAIYGYQKEFYVWSTDQRGTDALPELILDFESGVFCVGRAFRIL